MTSKPRRLILVAALLTFVPLLGTPARMEQAPAPQATRAIQLQDIIDWQSVGVTVLSNDGQWFAYRLAPQEGDARVIVRRTRGEKEHRFDVGETPQPDGGGRGGPAVGGAPSTLGFSDDSKWVAFTTYPSRAEQQRLRRQRRPINSSVSLVNLETGEKRDYARIRRFAFSGELSTWIALHRQPPQAAGGAAGGRGEAPTPPAGGGPGGAAAPERPRGTDLILRELATGQETNVGNVSEFAFTRDGKYLATVIDAQDRVGNGIQLRDLTKGTVTVLDHGDAVYERLTWTEKGDGLVALKGTDDKALRDKRYAVVGFAGVGTGAPKKTLYDPSKDKTFPSGMTVSGNRSPQFTESLDAILFGIHEPRRRDSSAPDTPAGQGEGEEGQTERPAQPGGPEADERVDLVLWHWKDARLQSQQEVQENTDRSFSYLAAYRVQPQKFIRLADDEVRNVTVAAKQRHAVGFDDREYELMGNLDGRRFRDVYAVDVETGERRLAIKRARWYNGTSPDGEQVLFYDEGHFHVHSLKTGQTRNITKTVPTSFVNVEADVNVVNPPTQSHGWTKDSRSVLLSDLWDIWQVPVDGGPAINLTGNGRKDQIRYQQRFALEPPEQRDEGIDLSVPQYFRAYGEWTKKSGIARIDPGKPGAQMVMWDDASYGRLAKARNADVYLYTRETATDPGDFYVVEGKVDTGQRITDQRPQVAQFAWTPGVQLVNYTCEKGDKLQAALFLPANYEKGKAYPTMVNFYERMSQTANTFQNPTSNGFNRSVYTSNGYAVLIPDIVYKVNDPGMSAVWCMVPAVKAAIATGIVDPKKIGITGHSWGGYQTSFLITQTDIFAAAVAGAPLTNMVSMYSLIYKNSGGGNMAIFESSQGRFKGGYWDHWDAYYRNSPVFFAKNVKTPLMILHNDRDGAVDFTQGVEYFSTLRRLGKPVIMLEYVGENHGLARRPNQRDYTVRMKEFFDHYLKGAPAPEWMTKGVPRLKMDEHLKERREMQKKKTTPSTTTTTAR
jgi:dipeptidyl aminopeptidase/acylaminoacyl peptidase